MLNALWAHATQERFAWYQKWRIGDLVLGDNRCVMHRRDAFDESLRRLMHRTQIVGEPVLAGVEADSALLSNASKAQQLFGPPAVTLEQMLDWTADWVARGGASIGKPTHFEVRDGRF